MLIERRARAQERRVVPETIARFLAEAAPYVPLALKPIANSPHTFDVPRTPTQLRRFETDPDWRLPRLAAKYPRCSTDRETAEEEHLEWVTPGHPLFEAVRRNTAVQARDHLGKGACFYSLSHSQPARLDFFRARIVDGLGQIIHERMFVTELRVDGSTLLREPSALGDLVPAPRPVELPEIALADDASSWLHENSLNAFLAEVRSERLGEIERIATHVELSLTELLQKADEEIGKAAGEVEAKLPGAEGRLSQAETRHGDLIARREHRRRELEQQRSLSLQAVERTTSVLVLPHPDRESPEVRNLRPDYEVEAIAMRVAIEHETSLGRQVYDVHEKNLGYDITSLDLNSGELRLIEVKGLGAPSGAVLLSPNERRVAEDRRDCYWLYVVTNCNAAPSLTTFKDPARLEWHEVTKVAHYTLAATEIIQSANGRNEGL
jgi:hypothetical protein